MHPTLRTLLSNAYIDSLNKATGTIETIFLRAGQGLGTSVEDLMQLRTVLARLSVVLGPEETQTLRMLCLHSVEHSAEISEDVQTFVQMAEALRAGIRKIQSNVSHLSVVIRTMSASAPISRILGKSLTRQEAKIDEFSIELARIAASADEQLKALQAHIEIIEVEMADLDMISLNLSRDMTDRVTPALEGLEAQIHEIQQDRDELAAGNAVIEAGMRDIFAEISAIVGELQTGDSVRQRLEHVEVIARASLDAALAQERPEASDGLSYLAICQAEASRDEIARDVASVLKRLGGIRRKSEQVLGAAEQVYLDPNDTQRKRVSTMIGCANRLSSALQSSQSNLDVLHRIGRTTQDHIGSIQTIAAEMGLLDHHIRMLGLNTFIVCCNMGSEAGALQELSRQVLSLTKISNEIFDQIATTTRTLAATTMPDVSQADDMMSRTVGFAQDISDRLKATDQAVLATKQGCAIKGDALKIALHASETSLASLVAAKVELDTFISGFNELISNENVGRELYDVLPSEQDRLAKLYAIYTMDAERLIHDRIFVGAEAPLALPENPAQSAGDELADIFF
ncbi:hypothetical protein rosmuc_01301 [Roseovarius mucosus DSM 17069]|uniref:Methyl-accepting chemotaxis protein n=1 Tax=Roseovarius mucosus DSM 17069 TaxID=1288298 RepID=A0A0A0HMP1_9RHOB|nr:transducer-like protein, TlpC [Roseovarius mucosus]KGM88470.1 hypothetical protein rosmuc_01301 [Roseovarius mucosus DSM 17069]